jgi:PAS domain S-box-containing protein
VWARRQPVWIPDVTEDLNFPRADFARSCGLKAGLGVPILSGDEVIAVLEFFLHETRDQDERLVEVICAVAAQIDLMVERRRAAEALRESEAKFRVLTETAASGILIYQGDKYRYANPAAETITGYAKEEIRTMTICDLVHPEFQELVRERAVARQRGEDVPSRYELKIITKNGEERWLDAAFSLMEFEGKPAILLTAFDITERKRAEEALQRNEVLFRAIVEDQTEMIVRWKPDGTRTFVNQAYCRVFGGSPEDFIGTTFYPQVAEKYREGIRVKVRSLTPESPLATEIHESALVNGEIRLQEWTDRGIFDEEGHLLELQSTGRDITERKRAEEALRESERRLSDTLTNIEMIAVMADMNGNITFCNDYLLRLTDWKREEAIGRNWYEMFLPEDEKSKVSEILLAVEPTGEVLIHMENAIKTRSGERRLVKWTNTTLRGLNGNVIGVAALGDDITERKKAEEQLRASSDQLRALSERLRSAKEEEGVRIARELHDELGSGLTSLKWSLLGLAKFYSGDQSREGQSSAQVKIEEMVGLVDATVNTVRRISSELRPSVLDDLGLVPAIEWHAQQFQEQTGIVCSFDSSVENVELNREQATTVFRVFQEAMTNILRHSRATKVNILIEEEEGEFVLEITDNGRGITENDKLGIHSLGLLGMRERANSVGARLDIDGIPGKGTKVVVRLPAIKEAAV